MRMIVRVALLVVLSIALAGCDQSYSYWALNDSDQPVLVEVHETIHRTFELPAHTYGGLFEGHGSVPPDGWTVAIVDSQCVTIQVWPVDPSHNLVYVAPDGSHALVNDPASGHGLRTATETSLMERVPTCP